MLPLLSSCLPAPFSAPALCRMQLCCLRCGPDLHHWPCSLQCLSVNVMGWPFMVLVATASIMQGSEVLYSYGDGYW